MEVAESSSFAFKPRGLSTIFELTRFRVTPSEVCQTSEPATTKRVVLEKPGSDEGQIVELPGGFQERRARMSVKGNTAVIVRR